MNQNMSEKCVYFFGPKEAEGNGQMRNKLGSKGASLAEMSMLGIPVPPGFTIVTDVCSLYYKEGCQLPEKVKVDVLNALRKMENISEKKFADPSNPLLVSVRSGSRASMPGMMDTVLNLGLNEDIIEGLVKSTKNEVFAWNTYRRFIQMYSNVVLGMNGSLLEVTLEDFKDAEDVRSDSDLTADQLKTIVVKFKKQILGSIGIKFPEDPMEQLWEAISAVFKSWNTPRAKMYRQVHSIPNEWGTAVNVQSMVFGNMGKDCATGVAFTRNPSTGEKTFFGEFLINAQGEDVVSGIRTPHSIMSNGSGLSLESKFPKAYAELVDIYKKLEVHYRDMQDIEFTIEKERLWMLQTRSGKRTAQAAVKIACDMLDEKLITEEEAVLRVDPASLAQLLHPCLDPDVAKKVLAKGLPASPGAAVGQVVFSNEQAEIYKEKNVILVRIETSPEDINGMIAASGILTSRGGMTSHAAVVARGMGKCCVVGCDDIQVDYEKREFVTKGHVIKEGDVITLDGSTGEVVYGEVKTIKPKLDGYFDRLMKLADRFKKLGVRANADNVQDALVAKSFGAEGIGLCRTEHMFFDPERVNVMRKMILAESKIERIKALNELLPMQKKDFFEIFKIIGPVTIRLFDPPLHEFVPREEGELKDLSNRLGIPLEKIKSKVSQLFEFNPMLGHRGCRLAITYPEIYTMQARAIAEAACEIVKNGKKIIPEIMIPLVGYKKELELLRGQIEEDIRSVQRERGQVFEYLIGTMIELPRAAIMADEIAEVSDFFSFGTNDLTQTALGISRDDAGKFLRTYMTEGIYERDPFVGLDQSGVGQLVRMGSERGRQKKKALKLGICGEHGGDPVSVEFFHKIGLNYVSCSPYRVPIARLAAAQASLSDKRGAH